MLFTPYYKLMEWGLMDYWVHFMFKETNVQRIPKALF